jgi:hypothetical protein
MNVPPRSFGVVAPLLLLAAALTLGGCSLFRGSNPPPCPKVSVLADAATFTRFRPGEGRDLTDVVLEGEVTGYSGACTYDKEKKQLTLTLQVKIDLIRGPAATSLTLPLEYFIAIPSFFPKPEAKRVLPLNVIFPSVGDRVHIVDNEVDIVLPAKDLAKDVEKDVVYIGFQLSQSELEYNRQRRATP